MDTAAMMDDPMLKAVLSNSKLTVQQKVEHLFQMAVHRLPRPAERAVVEEMLAADRDNPQLALRTIWFALKSASN